MVMERNKASDFPEILLLGGSLIELKEQLASVNHLYHLFVGDLGKEPHP